MANRKPKDPAVREIAQEVEQVENPIASGIKVSKNKYFKIVKFSDLSKKEKERLRDIQPMRGVIEEYRATDYVAGVASGITFQDRVLDANWDPYLPDNNSQWLGVIFDKRGNVIEWVDFLSCVTFSALSAIEASLNWLYRVGNMPKEAKDWFMANGYIVNGKFKLSNRYTAIRSGTTRQGNSLQKVIDSARSLHGILPYNMLPDPSAEYFADIKATAIDEFRFVAQDRYLDKTVITPAMDTLAMKALDYIRISYEWIVMPNVDGLDAEGKREAVLHHLRHGMLQFAKDGHAMDYRFAVHKQSMGIYDSYDPYKKTKPWDYDAPWVMKIVVDNLVGEKPEAIAKAKAEVLGFMKGRKAPYFARFEKNTEAKGEAYRVNTDGSFKYKHAIPGALFDDMATPESKGGTGLITPINEALWKKIKAAEIK